jgi:hypothetical protein
MVEFAIIAPLLFIIIFGIMELALMFNAYQQVHYAAFVAVRSAIVHIPDTYPNEGDTEGPYTMAQAGSNTPKKDAMERAAEIAMMPVSSPISAIAAEGIGNLSDLLSGLQDALNDAGGGLSPGDLPFGDMFEQLANAGDLGSLGQNAQDIMGGLGSLGDLVNGVTGLLSSAPRTPGRLFARWNPTDLLHESRPPATAIAWALGSGGGGGSSNIPNIPGIRQVDTDSMEVPALQTMPEMLTRAADKLVTSMIATKARAIDPVTKKPREDDTYARGEALTVRVTHYYNLKMPVVRTIFWRIYLTLRLRQVVVEVLPTGSPDALVDEVTNRLADFLGGVDLPYYPIAINADATLQIEGDRWCSPSVKDPDARTCSESDAPGDYGFPRPAPYSDAPSAKRGLE